MSVAGGVFLWGQIPREVFPWVAPGRPNLGGYVVQLEAAHFELEKIEVLNLFQGIFFYVKKHWATCLKHGYLYTYFSRVSFYSWTHWISEDHHAENSLQAPEIKLWIEHVRLILYRCILRVFPCFLKNLCLISMLIPGVHQTSGHLDLMMKGNAIPMTSCWRF